MPNTIKNNKGALSAILSDEINSHRARLAPFFNAQAKPNPSVSFANDGTGFGKSYNVFDQFIDHATTQGASGHRNLFFITPHKAQIDISAATQKKAVERGISILSFLSEQDLTDLDFTGWVTGVRNEELYKSWIKKLDTDYYSATINELKHATDGLRHITSENERFLRQGFSPYQNKDELEKRIKAAEKRLLNALQSLAKTVLCEQVNFAYLTSKELLQHSSKPREQAKTQIIDHLLPFERAKLEPTILLATTARFLQRALIGYIDRKNTPNIKKLWLDDILGGKRSRTAAEDRNILPIGSACGLNQEEQIDYLNTSYFTPDESSYFRSNAITFNLVIDEEHDSYNRFFADSLKRLLNKDVKPPHVIAGLHRLLETVSVNYGSEDEKPIAFDETVELINDLRRHYNEDCEASVELDVILEMCASNVGHITIDNRDVEQILALSRNIFSMSPRRFYNESALKLIRMRSVFGKSEIRLSFDDGSPCNDPTLYDFLQLMLCALYACSKIPQDSPLRQLLKLGASASQNAPLADFIKNACQHRDYIASVFDRTQDTQIFIDSFFTYFVPKVVFSLLKVDEITFDSEVAKNRVFVDLHLDLVRELPETKLLSVLHGTQNSAMCLSATTGFKDSYSGNFARKMLTHYGDAPNKNLGIRTVQRTAADLQTMTALRIARAKARTSQITPFYDTTSDRISALHNEHEFKQAYRFWSTALIGHVRENKYRMSAFKRQIETMLMAAWDGKNTFALSLNNRFTELFKDFFIRGGGSRLRGFKPLYQEQIFELTPFNDKSKIRVILFSAQLAKEVDINEYLRVDANTRICLLSAYQSAGTGLNLFTERAEDGLQQDFDRLVLINSPFYSDIFQRDSGFNSIRNHILLLKHISARQSHALRLSEFDANLMKPQNRRILNREHNLALLKDIIQAVGRVERRDTHLHTEIFLPSDLINHLMLMYSQLQREGNTTLINSLSLLNHRLMMFCLKQAKTQAFTTDTEREQFTASVAATAGDINNFFKGAFRNKILKSAREGNRDAIKFNELLRSPTSISAPEEYVQRLLESPLVKTSTYYQDVIKRFYLSRDVTDKITLCTTEESPYHLSDLPHGHTLYQPEKWVAPDYALASNHSDAGPSIINRASDKADKGIGVHLPNPALIPLLKGNMGELIFAGVLSALDIQPLSWEQSTELLGPEVYERYDFYLYQQDSLICIDVKHWSSTLTEEFSRKTLERAQVKRQLMITLCEKLKLIPRFLYVNTLHSHNQLNVQSEHNYSEPIHFLNAFKHINSYRPHMKQKNIYIANDSLVINPTLIQLLRSTE